MCSFYKLRNLFVDRMQNLLAQCAINTPAVILRIKIITTDILTLMNENTY